MAVAAMAFREQALASREQTLAGALALVTHVLFLALIVFGVSWQQKQVQTAMVAELWPDLPAVAPPKVEPPPRPAVKPESPPPAPKVEAKPPPPKPAPAPKPEIALKEKQEKQEKERKLKEQAAAEEKARAAEKAREAAEKKKRAEAAAQQAAAAAREIDKYKRLISDRVKRFIVLPPNVNAHAEVEFEIVVLPGGEVLSARLKRSSNSLPAYDSAVERAILKAQPLPLPPDPALMRQFRELNLVFRPDK